MRHRRRPTTPGGSLSENSSVHPFPGSRRKRKRYSRHVEQRFLHFGIVPQAIHQKLILQFYRCKLVAHGKDRLTKNSSVREKELTGHDCEPHELIYFKVYNSQIPVIDQAIEMAAMMLGSDKSPGYCLEMINADFLAGANLDSGQPGVLQFLSGEQ